MSRSHDSSVTRQVIAALIDCREKISPSHTHFGFLNQLIKTFPKPQPGSKIQPVYFDLGGRGIVIKTLPNPSRPKHSRLNIIHIYFVTYIPGDMHSFGE